MRGTRLAPTVCVLACLSICSGCVLGPAGLQASRIPYNSIIQRTSAEQLLLNLVRLRYREAPVFLEVGSVSASFVYKGSAEASGDINEGPNPINPDGLSIGGSVGYEEKPTISFTPLQGEDFVTRLLSPLSVETMLLLTRSGWRIDRVLRIAAQGMNGLDNASMASGPTPSRVPPYEEFKRVCSLWQGLQGQGVLELGSESGSKTLSDPIPAAAISGDDVVAAAKEGFKFVRDKDSDGYVLTAPTSRLIWRVSDDARKTKEYEELAGLLELQPDLYAYTLRQAGAQPLRTKLTEAKREAIEISSRSLIGAMFFLSHAIDVPESHREDGLVTITRDADGNEFDWNDVSGDLLRIHSCRMPPDDAAVAVRYRGWWFYIDDEDLNSKSTFALLGQLLALQAGGVKSQAPVLTLPVGG